MTITIPVILFVPPARPLVSMLDVGKHDDIDEVAQIAAATFPETIYWFENIVIDSPKPEFWPELEIKWTNWYGRIATDNVYACFSVNGPNPVLVEKLMLTEQEFASYAVRNSEVILFIREENG